MKFRRKPTVIEAVRYDGDEHSLEAMRLLAGHWISTQYISGGGVMVYVTTPRGAVEVTVGDWLIKGTPSDFYPCPDELFEATYEPLPE
jgi:hypothetical protein